MMIVVCSVLFAFLLRCDDFLYTFSLDSEIPKHTVYFYESEYGLRTGANFEYTSNVNIYAYRVLIGTKWIKVTHGSQRGEIKIIDPNSPNTIFVGNLFVQVCSETTACLSEHLFHDMDVKDSVRVSGIGFKGSSYLQTSTFKLEMGPIKADNRYQIFNIPTFGSDVTSIATAGIFIKLDTPDFTSDRVVIDDVTAMAYSAPSYSTKIEGMRLKILSPSSGFLSNSSFLMIGICGRTKINSECNTFHWTSRLYSQNSFIQIDKATPFLDKGIFYEISAYEFQNHAGSLIIRQNVLGWSFVNDYFDSSRFESPCYVKNFVCFMLPCSWAGNSCDSTFSWLTLNVKVYDYGEPDDKFLLNEDITPFDKCVALEKKMACSHRFAHKPIIPSFHLRYKECKIHLKYGKKRAYQICGRSEGNIKIILDWSLQ